MREFKGMVGYGCLSLSLSLRNSQARHKCQTSDVRCTGLLPKRTQKPEEKKNNEKHILDFDWQSEKNIVGWARSTIVAN